MGGVGGAGFVQPEIDGAVVARAGAGGDVGAADEGRGGRGAFGYPIGK